MSKEIKISIITVTFNAEQYFRYTLNSVLNQSFACYEYIVVDGGSKDSTLTIVEEYMPRFEGRLRFISEPDNGLYDAMNKGIKMASGDYIGIINADDAYKPEAFQHVVDALSNNGFTSDVVYSDLDVIDANEKIFRTIKGDASKLKRGMLVNHPTCFVRKEAYKKYGYFDLQYRICADYDLMLRILHLGGTFTKCDYTLAEYRWGGLSTANYNSILEKYAIQRKYYSIFHCLYIRARGFYRCKVAPALSFSGMKLVAKKIYRFYPYTTSDIANHIRFGIKGVTCGKLLKTRGLIRICLHRRNGGAITIGDSTTILSSMMANPVSNAGKTILNAFSRGQIHIGNRVGISNTVIVSYESVTIEDDVRIGANCCIWDTDHHSIYLKERLNNDSGIISKPILIKRGAFLGGGSIVLKGVTIGEEAVVGAGSVVTKDIPDREVWAGNPAKFIKKL